MVISGDEAVAVVNLNPVAATPGVPPGCPDYSGVRCVDTRPTCSGKILPPVELTGFTCKRVVPHTER